MRVEERKMTECKRKRIRKALRLFGWRVTHLQDCGCLFICHNADGESLRGHSCLGRSLKELNNLTGIHITPKRVEIIQEWAARHGEEEHGVDSTMLAINWAVSKYSRSLRSGKQTAGREEDLWRQPERYCVLCGKRIECDPEDLDLYICPGCE